MPDLAHILERTSHEVALAPDRFERLLRRRDRRRRRERIVAGAVAILITILALGGVLSALWNKNERVPSNEITPSNVRSLGVMWTGDVGGPAPAPAITEGVVATATADGHLTAFDESCASDGSSCAPLWTADVGPLPALKDRITAGLTWWPGATGPPNERATVATVAASDGVFYLLARSGRLWAFADDCRTDGGACDPIWTGQAGRVPASTPPKNELPVISDRFVYATTPAGVYAFSINCRSDGGSCVPAWHTSKVDRISLQDGQIFAIDRVNGLAYELDPATGRPIWWGGPGPQPGPCCGNTPIPIRFGDSVYTSFGHDLYVFPASCTGSCGPTWTAKIFFPYADGPLVVGDAVVFTTAFDGTHGGLLAFPMDCATGGARCNESHRTAVSAELTTWSGVADQGRVYAVSRRSAGMFVFDASCLIARNGCQPVWTAPLVSPDQPLIEGGVVFVSDEDVGVKAFDESCDADPCPALWEGKGPPAVGPTIQGGMLFATDTTTGNLVAYGMSSGDVPGEPGSASGSLSWIAYLGLALAVGVSLWIARRRRTTGGPTG